MRHQRSLKAAASTLAMLAAGATHAGDLESSIGGAAAVPLSHEYVRIGGTRGDDEGFPLHVVTNLSDARARGVTPTAETPGSGGSERVGQAPPEDDDRVEAISAITDTAGVLTPAGHLSIEGGIEYSNASVNRFTFRGIELQEVLLIGVIEASDADRQLVSANATVRYGVTDRLEVEARVPFLFRSDELTFLIPVLGEEDPLERRSELDGSGLGDIEVAAHYQINDGRDGWPIFVGNARFKTRTGKGPFEVSRDEFGVETELPTGSGFYEVEPSITMILPSDPAVLFANFGYGFRIPRDVNTPVGEFIVRNVDPGDAINASVGMGFAVNEDLTFSLGYKHTFVRGTETELFVPATGVTTTQDSGSLHIGSATFGLGYRLSDTMRLNLDFDLGITEDAPDMRASLRMSYNLGAVY